MEKVELKQVILFEAAFLPGIDGKAVNLKPNIVVGKQDAGAGTSVIRLTLLGNTVEIETPTATGLIPLSACKMLVPANKPQVTSAPNKTKA